MTYIWVIQLFNYSLHNPLQYQSCVRLDARALRDTEITHYGDGLIVLTPPKSSEKSHAYSSLQCYKAYIEVWRTFVVSQKTHLAISSRLWQSVARMALGMCRVEEKPEKWSCSFISKFELKEGTSLRSNRLTSGTLEALSSGCFKLVVVKYMKMAPSQPFPFIDNCPNSTIGQIYSVVQNLE